MATPTRSFVLLDYRRRKLLLGLAPLLFFVVGLLSLRLMGERASVEAAIVAVVAAVGCLGTAGLAIVEALPPRRPHDHTPA